MANRNEAPEIIMFVRHGEKPGEGSLPHGVNHHGEIDEHSLSVKGWTRAGALAGLFPSSSLLASLIPSTGCSGRFSDGAVGWRSATSLKTKFRPLWISKILPMNFPTP